MREIIGKAEENAKQMNFIHTHHARKLRCPKCGGAMQYVGQICCIPVRDRYRCENECGIWEEDERCNAWSVMNNSGYYCNLPKGHKGPHRWD